MARFRTILRNLTCILFLTTYMFSCSSDPLQQLMQEIVENPVRQTAAGYAEISKIINSRPEAYAPFITDNGSIDTNALQKALEAIAAEKNMDFNWDITAYGQPLRRPLELRILLERSGSMAGYDPRSGSGNFKRVINELITRFPTNGHQPRLFIVNDSVYDFGGNIESFLQNRDVFSSTADIGDASFTDFAGIFNHALRDTVPENITVLISDLIYSPRDTKNVSSSKILNESSSLVRQLFCSHPDKSVLLIKLRTDFNGTYYPYDSPYAGFPYKGDRPYYLMIIGSSSAMEELTTNPAYASFSNFNDLPGYITEYSFNRVSQPSPYYTVIPPQTGNDGNYFPDGSTRTTGANSIGGIEAGSDGQTFTFRIAADFSGVKADSLYLSDISNFRVSRGAKLTSIHKISQSDLTPRNRQYMQNATHLLEVRSSTAPAGNCVTIELLNRLPSWIKESDTTDDSTPFRNNFANSTFGLRAMVEGIYNAFYGNAELPVTLRMNIKLEK